MEEHFSFLGWEFFVRRQDGAVAGGTGTATETLARWKAGLGGDKWLHDLVSEGLAANLGGNGYPNRFTVSAGVLVSVLAAGPPSHGGPPVIGDNYLLPGGWTGDARIDLEQLRHLDKDEALLVVAWDQS